MASPHSLFFWYFFIFFSHCVQCYYVTTFPFCLSIKKIPLILKVWIKGLIVCGEDICTHISFMHLVLIHVLYRYAFVCIHMDNLYVRVFFKGPWKVRHCVLPFLRWVLWSPHCRVKCLLLKRALPHLPWSTAISRCGLSSSRCFMPCVCLCVLCGGSVCQVCVSERLFLT